MAERYLLDTNILSELIRSPSGTVAAKAAKSISTGDHICTSIIVAAECRFGAAKKGSVRLQERVEQLLAEIDVLPFESDADERYATLRVDLERGGQVVGGNDMLIAAHALATASILVTHNVREFQRIESLRLEDWLTNA